MKAYSAFIRPLLDLLSGFDRERAHYHAIFALRLCGAPLLHEILSHFTFVKNERTVFGITFPNPVGAAAGFDKRGVALRGIEAFGFGFAEVGTVTPMPQAGNPKPRLFRLSEDSAIINRMGFNNEGVAVFSRRLHAYRSLRIPVGVNIGKNKDTPLEHAAADYEACIESLYSCADYFTINISSPNTKDLRLLHEKNRLSTLLDRVVLAQKRCAPAGSRPKPVLLKISPDLSDEQLDDVLSVSASRVQGLVICNTTIDRLAALSSKYRGEAGGLSGRPLQAHALELVRKAHVALPTMPIVGVGGVFTPEDAIRMFDAGASLVQLYTGLVFEGPLLSYRINKALLGKL